MSFFHSTEPIIRIKQQDLDVQDLKGLLKIQLKIGDLTLFSGFYTRIDQVFWLWAVSTLIIFMIAQFFPISWISQAYWWSVLTVVATLAMGALAYCWVRVEQVTWIIYWWALLMFGGLGLTNFGIFWGWSSLLPHLCPLWLMLCALGYFGTAWGLRSRAFILAGLFHLLGMVIIPYVGGWQFFTTGAIMSGTLLLLAEFQWDMSTPIESKLLTVEELSFNQDQHRKRQIRG